GVGVGSGRSEDRLRAFVGAERFAFFYADRLEQVDHRPVAIEPGLDLYHAVERLEEAQVVRNRIVVDDVNHVDEDGCRRLRRGRQWVDLDLLAIVSGPRHVGGAAARGVGAQNAVALIRGRPHRNVALGYMAFVARRSDQIPAAFSFVHAGRPDVLDR